MFIELLKSMRDDTDRSPQEKQLFERAILAAQRGDRKQLEYLCQLLHISPRPEVVFM